ncbi:MAG: class I SAM-dependent methyltransferase [Patescibacteria group bacterium]
MIDQYAVLAHYYDALVSTRNTDAVRGDKKFYVEEAIASGGPVLEFGAGTLRMSLAIGKVGIRVIAVDNSPAMIEIAVKKRARHAQEIRKLIEITQGDMRNFSVFEKVPLALIPFRAFQNLLTPNDQRRCLENAFRNLLPSGKLIFDIFDPRLEVLAPSPNDAFGVAPRFLCAFTNPENSNTVSVSLIRTSVDHLQQIFTEQWIFDELSFDGTLKRVQQELRLRWSYRYEIQYLLLLCGFRPLDLFGNFSRGQFCYGEHQIWVAEKPR